MWRVARKVVTGSLLRWFARLLVRDSVGRRARREKGLEQQERDHPRRGVLGLGRDLGDGLIEVSDVGGGVPVDQGPGQRGLRVEMVEEGTLERERKDLAAARR